jgi:hypothetical protein
MVLVADIESGPGENVVMNLLRGTTILEDQGNCLFNGRSC